MILENETKEKYNFDPNIRKGNTLKETIVKCDFCGDVFEKKLFYVLRDRSVVEIDCCSKKECRKEKNKKIYLKKFGVESPNQLDSVKQKRVQTFIKNLGVDNPSKSKEVREKIKNTNIEKYGAENPLQNKDIKQKQENTMVHKYGVKSAFQCAEVLNKAIEKLKTQEVIEKRNNTMNERYGENNAAKIEEFSEKKKETNMEKYGVECYFQDEQFIKENSENRKMTWKKILDYCKQKGYEPCFEYENYCNKYSSLDFRCIKHDHVFKSKMTYILIDKFNQCPKCRNYSTSKEEKEVLEYIKSIYSGLIIENDRKEIYPNELDILLPEKRIAFEYNGLYWHSVIYKGEKYHREKFITCKQKGIKLVQIFEDEWRDKTEICKSIICNKLGLTENKLNARDLKYIFVSPRTSAPGLVEKVCQFTDENHLQGHAKFNSAFCLVNDNEQIVCCLTMRPPFTKDKKGVIEIARLCSKNYTSVRGGFGRLFKHAKEWAKLNGYSKVLTYSDCRLGEGGVYQSNGFDFKCHNPPNYFYFGEYTQMKREGRFKWRAQKPKTEKQVCDEKGVVAIYDSGHYKWEINL